MYTIDRGLYRRSTHINSDKTDTNLIVISYKTRVANMPLIASNPTTRVILGLMTFGPDETTGKGHFSSQKLPRQLGNQNQHMGVQYLYVMLTPQYL